jgi:cysteine synthase
MARKIKANVLEAIGGTPLVKLLKLPGRRSASVFAKVESLNPGGSVKDRIAWSMVLDAERKGLLAHGGTIVEPTSGNTGIGLAMVGAVRGYRVILVLTDSISFERYHLLRSFGAEIVFSPAERGMQGAVEMAESMILEHPDYFMPQQFNNPSNPEIHRRTTAREILRTLGDEPVHAFVAGVGTGGTITGVKKSLPPGASCGRGALGVAGAVGRIACGHEDRRHWRGFYSESVKYADPRRNRCGRR